MLTLHRFQPRGDNSFRLQETASALAQSTQEADQPVVLEIGRENVLKDRLDHTLQIQEGLPGIIHMQCLVLLKSPYERHKRLMALSDAACELLETVSVEGHFQIRDQPFGSGNCFTRMRGLFSVPEGVFRVLIFAGLMAAMGDLLELAQNVFKM